MARSRYYLDGFEEGKGASYETDWQEGEMQAAYDQDTLGEVAGQILENWQQMAGTVYYQDLTERQLDNFEEGFYAGFERGVREQLKGGRRKRTLQRGNPGSRGNPSSAYDVFLRGKKIDTVFQSDPSSAEEVKRSLVEHDGYDPDIRVVKQRRKSLPPLFRRRRNPGATWHREQAQLAERQVGREERAGRSGRYFRGKADAHMLSEHESRKMGLNPEEKVGQARRVSVRQAFKKSRGAWEWQGRRIMSSVGPGAVELEPGTYLDLQTGVVYRKNPKSEADPTAARELLLFIENSEPLYRQQLLPIYANLDRKRKRGVYDREKAVKLFLYLADNGARLYNQEVMGQKGIPSFLTRATRLLVARDLRDRYEEEERDVPKPNPRGARTLVGRVFKAERWAKRWARGRPIRKVKGGWQILAGRKRTPTQERVARPNPDIGMTFNTKAKANRYAAAMQKLGHSVSIVPQQYGTWRVVIHEMKKNPIAVYNPPEGRMIYGRVLAVEAQKTNGSHRGKKYRHSFEGDSRVVAYALQDGSVLLKSTVGKRLWQDRR